jgi:hypothetical protein
MSFRCRHFAVRILQSFGRPHPQSIF